MASFEHSGGVEWSPIQHVVCWSDEMSRERMTVMVLMPTGVDEDFQCRVIDGTELEITMNWPMSFYAICGFLRSVEKTNKNSFLLVTQNYYTQDSKLVRITN